MASDRSEGPSNELEATQLQDHDNASPTGSNEPSNTNAACPETWLGKQTRPIKVFWRRQIVATVPHNGCRDHFGTSSFTLISTDDLWLRSLRFQAEAAT